MSHGRAGNAKTSRDLVGVCYGPRMPNAPNVGSAGSTPPREDEARLGGARAEFVGSLPRRLDALRASLRSAEEVPSDAERISISFNYSWF